MYVLSTLLYIGIEEQNVSMMVDVHGRYTMYSNSLVLDRCKFVVTHASFYHQGVELFNMLPPS